MSELGVWHDEADRLRAWGCLDPTDACMCRECVLPDDDSLVPSTTEGD